MDQDILDLLQSAIAETGADMGDDLDALRTLAAEKMAQLALGVGQAGFQEAVIAARDSIALRFAINVTMSADATDARIVGIIQGVLAIGARAIAGAA